jgi:hypothetical protein
MEVFKDMEKLKQKITAVKNRGERNPTPVRLAASRFPVNAFRKTTGKGQGMRGLNGMISDGLTNKL